MRLNSLSLLSLLPFLALLASQTLATPPPDLIEAIEAAKLAREPLRYVRDDHVERLKRRVDSFDKELEGKKEKKWVVLPSGMIPGEVRQPPPPSTIFTHPPHGHHRRRKEEHRVNDGRSTTMIAAEDDGKVFDPSTYKILRDNLTVEKRGPPPPTVTSSAPIASNTSPVVSTKGNSTVTSQVNPWDPFQWPQAVNNQYVSTTDQFHQLSSLSKIGLATLIILSTLTLFVTLFCCCKLHRQRRRRREERIRIKAEAARISNECYSIGGAYYIGGRGAAGGAAGGVGGNGRRSKSESSGSRAGSIKSIESNSKKNKGGKSSPPKYDESIDDGSPSNKGGWFNWLKKKTRTSDSGEVLPVQDRHRHLTQNALSWDSQRGKSWDARNKYLGTKKETKVDMVEAPKARGGSMKSRSRSTG